MKSTLARTTASELCSLYESSLEKGEQRTLIADKDLSNQEIALTALACTDFVNTDLTNTVLRGCDLRGASFEQAVLNKTRLVDCCLGGCSFPPEALAQKNGLLETQGCYWQIVGKA